MQYLYGQPISMANKCVGTHVGNHIVMTPAQEMFAPNIKSHTPNGAVFIILLGGTDRLNST